MLISGDANTVIPIMTNLNTILNLNLIRRKSSTDNPCINNNDTTSIIRFNRMVSLGIASKLPNKMTIRNIRIDPIIKLFGRLNLESRGLSLMPNPSLLNTIVEK